MGVKIVATFVAIIFLSTCSARVISQSAISSVLQDIMSPANTDKAMQLINMLAKRANKKIVIPNLQGTVFDRNECGLPIKTVTTNNLPLRMVANEIQLPRRVVANEIGLPGLASIVSSDQRLSPENVYPQRKIVRQIVREVAPANFIGLPKEIYQTVPITVQQESIVNRSPPPVPAPNLYLPVASPASSPYLPVASSAQSPYMPFELPNSYLPVDPIAPSSYLASASSNPYLPIASPLSAMSSSYLPPPTQSKGQFLRKIPIPPPTL